MIGRTYKKKHTDQYGAAGELWRVVGDNQDGRWVLTPCSFGQNVPYSSEQIRREFTRAGDIEPPTQPDEQAGWNAMSANQKFAALAVAVESDALAEGDYLTHPTVSGEQVEAREPLTKEDIGVLKRHARRLRGAKAPTPEAVFEAQQVDQITEAADKVWNSSGPDGLLAKFETGNLEVAPAVGRLLDQRIRERNRREDRATYSNAYIFDRTGRR